MLRDVDRHRVPVPESGIEIAVLDFGGDGAPALFHHANGFCAGVLAEIAEGLRGRFRIFAMDCRGHGNSSKPSGAAAYDWGVLAGDVLAVAEWVRAHAAPDPVARERASRAVGRKEASIALGFGHSFGGALLLAAAAARPRLFDRVFAVDPVILPPMTKAQMALRAQNHGMSEAARKRRDTFPSREEARSHFASRELFMSWTDAALDAYVEEGLAETADGEWKLKCAGETEATVFETGHTLGIFDRIATLETPSRLLHARKGNFPVELYEALVARAAPGVATIESLDVGHLVPMEQPEIVIEAALRFCDEAPAAGT